MYVFVSVEAIFIYFLKPVTAERALNEFFKGFFLLIFIQIYRIHSYFNPIASFSPSLQMYAKNKK